MSNDESDEGETDTTSVLRLSDSPRVRSGRGFLTVLSGKRLGNVIVVDRESIIGRGSDVRVVIPDEGVSRSHAQIALDRVGKATIRDLGSTNGTFLNGERISEEEPLRDGDRIQLGRATMLRFRHEYRDPSTPIPPISQAEALAGAGLGDARPTLLDRGQQDQERENDPMLRSSEVMDDLVEGVASTLDNLGNMYESRGDLGRALEIFRRSLEIHERKLGARHATIGSLLVRIAVILEARGDIPGARDHADRAYRVFEESTGDDEDALSRLRALMARLESR